MPVWTVPATVTRVVDGDTLLADLDLGWHITYHAKIRLAGINCPERNTTAGSAALAFVIDRLRPAPGLTPTPIKVVSRSLDKYGRVLGDVFYDLDPTGAGRRHLNADLVNAGHAVVVQ